MFKGVAVGLRSKRGLRSVEDSKHISFEPTFGRREGSDRPSAINHLSGERTMLRTTPRGTTWGAAIDVSPGVSTQGWSLAAVIPIVKRRRGRRQPGMHIAASVQAMRGCEVIGQRPCHTGVDVERCSRVVLYCMHAQHVWWWWWWWYFGRPPASLRHPCCFFFHGRGYAQTVVFGVFAPGCAFGKRAQWKPLLPNKGM